MKEKKKKRKGVGAVECMVETKVREKKKERGVGLELGRLERMVMKKERKKGEWGWNLGGLNEC
jgi:hypothetical protein